MNLHEATRKLQTFDWGGYGALAWGRATRMSYGKPHLYLQPVHKGWQPNIANATGFGEAKQPQPACGKRVTGREPSYIYGHHGWADRCVECERIATGMTINPITIQMMYLEVRTPEDLEQFIQRAEERARAGFE